jgi:predicted cupin superfamily sugar epimerase
MVWQSAKLKKGGNFALLGTTVSPAFEYEDFELADEKIEKFFIKNFHKISHK